METSRLLEAEEDGDVYDLLNKCINKIGFGDYQLKLFLLCGLGWASDNAVFQCLAAILPLLKLEFQLDGWEIGVPSTSLYVGAMLGALFWGFCSDRYGRKPIFTATLGIAGLFLIICAFQTTVISISLSLFCVGFGIGGNLPIDGSLFLEFIPKQNQNMLALMSIFWPIGQMTTAILALFVISPSNSCQPFKPCNPIRNYGWRYLILATGVLILLMLFARVTIMTFFESPKSLVSRGFYKEALQILECLAEQNKVDIDLSVQELESTDVPLRSDFNYWPLFDKDISSTTFGVISIWMLVALGFNIFHGFLPFFLQEHGISGQEPYTNFFIISLFGIPGSVAGMFLCETWLGRKGTMAISTFGTASCLLLFILLKSATGQLVSASLESFLSNAMYGTIYTYRYIIFNFSPEVFPAPLREKGVGLASALGRLSGAFAPTLTGALLQISSQLPLYFSAVSLILCFFCMLTLKVETRGQNAR